MWQQESILGVYAFLLLSVIDYEDTLLHVGVYVIMLFIALRMIQLSIACSSLKVVY